MSSQYFSILPKFTEFMSSRFFYNDLVNSECLTKDESHDMDESLYDLNELEEVFSDHILMGKRLQKTLYGGNIDDIDDDADHPPIVLTDLALKLFTKAVPNYGLDQLDMDYVSSVSGATSVSPCAMILALIYLERLRIKNSDYLESVSPSGLFVVTMLVASKFLFENEEDIVSNQLWSEALNIDVNELNQLEQKFLSAIDWRLYVDSSEYFAYLSNIEKMIAVKQSSLRGWLSYSDVYSILQDAAIRKSLLNLIERIIKVFALSTLSYAVTLLSLYVAGLAVHCRYEYHQSASRDHIQTETSSQKSLHIFTNVELESDINIVESSLSNSSSVFSDLFLNAQKAFHHEYNVRHLYQSKNHQMVQGNGKKASTLMYSDSSSLKIGSRYDFYIYNNSFLRKLMTQTLYKLQWLPIDCKNVCVSVQ